MGVPEKAPKLTEAEYLTIERAAEFKSEFHDGEMFAMAGGTPMHSLIATNAARELGNRLEGRPCVPFNADLRIKVEATGLLTYPDLSVICGPMEFASGTNDTATNPTLLIEVLSDSTEAYDRGMKFEHYQQIATLKEYLLVSQREPRIVQYVKQSRDEWLWRTVAGSQTTLALPSLDITISLATIYANVSFPPAPIRPPAPPRR